MINVGDVRLMRGYYFLRELQKAAIYISDLIVNSFIASR